MTPEKPAACGRACARPIPRAGHMRGDSRRLLRPPACAAHGSPRVLGLAARTPSLILAVRLAQPETQTV